MVKQVQLDDATYLRLSKLKGEHQAKTGEPFTFADVINDLIANQKEVN
jgi:predicted CopG family antitoxin